MELFNQQLVLAYTTVAEVIRIGLQVHLIWQNLVVQCVQAMQNDLIVGRVASYCISEVLMLIHSFSDNAKIASTWYNPATTMEFLQDLVELCINPFLQLSSNSTINDNTSSNNRSNFSHLESAMKLCLELVPTAITMLSLLQKQHTAQRDKHRMNAVEIVFYIPLTLELLLPSANMLCEVFPFMKTKFVVQFKVGLLRLVYSFTL